MAHEFEKQRILVALDASPPSMAACRAAAAIAAATRSELVGLFVEDINLLRCAQLPCVTEVGAYSASVRTFDTQEVESRLRAQAAQARQTLQRCAEHHRVTWSFQVSRGAVSGALRAAAREADLVSLGRVSWSRPDPDLGSTARSVLGAPPGRFLLLGRSTEFDQSGPVRVLLEDPASARELVTAGVRLSPIDQPRVQVLTLARDQATAHRLEQQIRTALAQVAPVPLDVQWLGSDTQDLLRAARTFIGGLLVISATSPSVRTEATLPALLRAVACPVLRIG